MVIQNRPVAAGYKLCLGLLATIGLVIEVQIFGWNALRLFDTWILLIASLYYLVAAVLAIFRHSRPVDSTPWPMLQGAIIVNSIGLTTLWMIYRIQLWSWPGVDDAAATLINFLLPLLFVLDWALFSRKGRFSTSEPLNWLAFPIIMMSAILVSAVFMPKNDSWRYPYGFLNYPANGIEQLFWWTLIIVALYLAVGYAFVVLDNLCGGQIARHIVMPKIKTIVVEEEAGVSNETAPQSSNQRRQANKSKSHGPQTIEGLSDHQSAAEFHAKKSSKSPKAGRLDLTKPQSARTAARQKQSPKRPQPKSASSKRSPKELLQEQYNAKRTTRPKKSAPKS